MDQNGQFQGFRASNRDVTERKTAETKVQQHRDELSHVTRVAAMGELTGSLAHELNQPLAAILNYASAAQRFLAGAEPNMSKLSEALHGIIQNDKRAAEVIRNVRALLKKQGPDYSILDMNHVIKEYLDLIPGESIMGGLSIATELAPGLPTVRGDAVQLQQVLLNLTLNAAAAMSDVMPEFPRLVVRTEIWEDQGVKVSVRDFGTGIDEDHKDRLFEPLYTTKPKGLGMGLAICQNIVHAHGGSIWAENNPDRGATFYFTLQAAGRYGKDEYRISNKEFRIMKFSVGLLGDERFCISNNSNGKTNQPLVRIKIPILLRYSLVPKPELGNQQVLCVCLQPFGRGGMMVRSRVFFALMVILVFLGAPICPAQDDNITTQSQTVAPQGYPVVLGNQTLFTITQEVEGYSPEQRANGMSERITRIADDPGFPISAVNTFSFDIPLSVISAENNLLAAFSAQDAGAVGLTREELAAKYAENSASP